MKNRLFSIFGHKAVEPVVYCVFVAAHCVPVLHVLVPWCYSVLLVRHILLELS